MTAAPPSPSPEEANATESPSSPSPPPSIFIRNLSILSPRQKKSTTNSSNTNNNNGNDDPVYEETFLPLPPLRPEEPVASLRGALSEVVGFAHL
eukprot:CAMPEP_0183709790 /NCGR_PEP_ID=MMETSP0737-20130205/5766_1 /TAXON_ID=385413 /ORGANISM="Thalassiosira miniscula, Strain CCMP1093" /LENGTH=93 /DNA_ID=CAMNT_0025937983 /DNA_START=84 /DNA_END=361 /DNA_ORIENTATION=+